MLSDTGFVDTWNLQVTPKSYKWIRITMCIDNMVLIGAIHRPPTNLIYLKCFLYLAKSPFILIAKFRAVS